jgi:hypothetical protein
VFKSHRGGGKLNESEVRKMDTTLEVLPKEGETKVIKKKRVSQECEICGEPAHYKHTFLLEGTRSNPASSAFRKDDCSWCEDEKRFVCKKHQEDRIPPDGYVWCSTFPASERFAHMFLYWEEKEQ